MGILSTWWIIWKAINDFIHRGWVLNPSKLTTTTQKIPENPIGIDRDISFKNDENISKVSKVPTVIPNKEDFIFFLDAAISLRRV